MLKNSDIEKLFNVWDLAILGFNTNISSSITDLDKETIKAELYRRLCKRLDSLIVDLCIEKPSETLSKYEYSNELFNQLSRFRFEKSAFYPKRIAKSRQLNCAGGTMLAGYLLNKANIKNEYGRPAGHSMAFVHLDNKIYWMDSSNKVFEEVKLVEDILDGVRVYRLKTANPKIPYRIVPVFSSQDIIINIFNNVDAMMVRAKLKTDKVAEEIVREDGQLLTQITFDTWRAFLYPEYNKFQRTNKEFEEEKARIKKLHGDS